MHIGACTVISSLTRRLMWSTTAPMTHGLSVRLMGGTTAPMTCGLSGRLMGGTTAPMTRGLSVRGRASGLHSLKPSPRWSSVEPQPIHRHKYLFISYYMLCENMKDGFFKTQSQKANFLSLPEHERNNQFWRKKENITWCQGTKYKVQCEHNTFHVRPVTAPTA